jgi:C1A family cysteine protease
MRVQHLRRDTMHRYGYKPSPPDKIGMGHPHHLLGAVPTPPSASVRDKIVEVLDQQDTSSCVAHATTQQVRTALAIQGIISPPLPSRLFVYFGARAEYGEQKSDDGTYIHAAYEAMRDMGFPSEDAWPFSDDPKLVNELPPWSAFRRAADQRWLAGNYRILTTGTQRVQDVKSALAAGHPVTWGTDLDQAFEDLIPGQVWPGVTGAIIGGHAILIVGYATGYFEVCNSWGAGWCDGGFCRVSEAAIASPKASDFWVATVAPTYSEVA